MSLSTMPTYLSNTSRHGDSTIQYLRVLVVRDQELDTGSRCGLTSAMSPVLCPGLAGVGGVCCVLVQPSLCSETFHIHAYNWL